MFAFIYSRNSYICYFFLWCLVGRSVTNGLNYIYGEVNVLTTKSCFLFVCQFIPYHQTLFFPMIYLHNTFLRFSVDQMSYKVQGCVKGEHRSIGLKFVEIFHTYMGCLCHGIANIFAVSSCM